MGSTVKKIAKVAIIAAATYYGGKYAMSMMGTGGVAASSSFPTLLSTAGGVGVPSGFLGMLLQIQNKEEFFKLEMQ